MWGTRAQGATLAGLAAGVSLIAGMALAQDPSNPFAGECNRTATPEEIDGARGAHQAAKQFYERAEYTRAIQYWRDVFNFDCNAVNTLLNIANAYEKLGDRQNAIFALEAYVKRVKAADPEVDASKIEARIQNLQALLQAQASASASASSSAAPPPPSATAPPPPPPPSATTPPIMGKPYGFKPLIPIVAGAAVFITGGVVAGAGSRQITNAQERCKEAPAGQWSCPNQADVDAAKTGQTMVLTGKIVLGVGLAGMAGGFAWELFLNKRAPMQPDKPAKGSVHLSPSMSPGMTGATLHGTF